MKVILTALMLAIGVASSTANQHVSRKFYKLDKLDPSGILKDLKINQNKLKTGSSTDLPGTTQYFTWSDTVWTKESTITTVCNTAGNPISELWDQVILNDRKFFYSYNQDDLTTELLCRTLDHGVWKDSTRERWEFNSQKDQTLYVNEYFEQGAWAINDGVRSEFEYSGNLLIKEIYSKYNIDSKEWDMNERYTYSYNNGILLSETIEVYTNGVWVLNARFTDFTGTQGRVDSSYVEIWSGAAWEKAAKEEFSYIGDFGMEILMYEYDTVGREYVKTDRWYQDYNDQGNLKFFSWEIWSDTAWMMMVGMRTAETLENQRVILRITEAYYFDWMTGLGGAWENYTREEFSDFLKLGTDPLLTPSPGITCYPNPAGSQTTVSFTLPNTGNFVLAVFSLNGQKVLEQSISPGSSQFEYQLNLDKVPVGSYVLVATEPNSNVLGTIRIIKTSL